MSNNDSIPSPADAARALTSLLAAAISNGSLPSTFSSSSSSSTPSLSLSRSQSTSNHQPPSTSTNEDHTRASNDLLRMLSAFTGAQAPPVPSHTMELLATTPGLLPGFSLAPSTPSASVPTSSALGGRVGGGGNQHSRITSGSHGGEHYTPLPTRSGRVPQLPDPEDADRHMTLFNEYLNYDWPSEDEEDDPDFKLPSDAMMGFVVGDRGGDMFSNSTDDDGDGVETDFSVGDEGWMKEGSNSRTNAFASSSKAVATRSAPFLVGSTTNHPTTRQGSRHSYLFSNNNNNTDIPVDLTSLPSSTLAALPSLPSTSTSPKSKAKSKAKGKRKEVDTLSLPLPPPPTTTLTKTTRSTRRKTSSTPSIPRSPPKSSNSRKRQRPSDSPPLLPPPSRNSEEEEDDEDDQDEEEELKGKSKLPRKPGVRGPRFTAEEKLERRRARNKQSAAASRNKKNEALEMSTKRVAELEEQNRGLREKVEKLEKELEESRRSSKGVGVVNPMELKDKISTPGEGWENGSAEESSEEEMDEDYDGAEAEATPSSSEASTADDSSSEEDEEEGEDVGDGDLEEFKKSKGDGMPFDLEEATKGMTKEGLEQLTKLLLWAKESQSGTGKG